MRALKQGAVRRTQPSLGRVGVLAVQSETLLLRIAWRRGLALASAAQASGDPADYVACAEHFEQLLADNPDHERADALRSNAQACRDGADPR